MEQNKLLTTKKITYCAIFTALITIGAFIQIPVPFMDYFTLQFFFVLLAEILLGSKLGALAVLLYVVIGLLGLPIFAAGGGLAYIVRPSFGYLIGFIAGAYVTGIICEKTNEIAAKKYVLAVLSGLLATYMIGLGYKYIILNYYTGTPITWKLVLLSCFPLDLPGDLFLSFLAVGTGIRFEKIFKKRRIQC